MTMDIKNITGPQRAAVMLLALGEEFGKPIWDELDEEEIRILSAEMAQLGNIESQLVEALFEDFSKKAKQDLLRGDYEGTEKLLSKMLPKTTVDLIMEEVRGPAGRNMWQKLTNVQPALLANYLKSEYPQTIAVILSKIRSDHTAKILCELPPKTAEEVVNRMLTMGPVPRDVLDQIDHALRSEFIASLSRAARRDPHDQMADIMHQLGSQEEPRFFKAIERENPAAAEKIRSLMFVFEDMARLQPNEIQTIITNSDRGVLARALKGSSELVRNKFLSNMTQRAGRAMNEEMISIGPLRLKEVDEAQQTIITTAKRLESEDLISLAKRTEEADEMVF